jgi:hypothetical protein
MCQVEICGRSAFQFCCCCWDDGNSFVLISLPKQKNRK